MIKNINKKALGLVMAGVTLVTVPMFTSCSKKNEDGLYSISQDCNEFDKYRKMIIRNGEVTEVYSGKNIIITVDKDTFNVKEYICAKESLDVIDDIYDLRTGEIIVDKTLTEIESYTYYSKKNYDFIKNNVYIIEFNDINCYVEGEELKQYYTLEEIEQLESQIVVSVKKISSYEKVKSKNLKNVKKSIDK